VADKPTKGQRRYGNPPKIKLAEPTVAEAEEAKPVATTESSAPGVTVNVNITHPGSMKV